MIRVSVDYACHHVHHTKKKPEVVFYKPSGWEVYGGHNEFQLVQLAKSWFGDRHLFNDLDHHHGFLLPGSWLILVEHVRSRGFRWCE